MKSLIKGCYSLLSVVMFLLLSVSAVAQVQETKLISKSISPLGEITLVSEMEDGHQFILKFPSLEKRLEGENYFHHSDFPSTYGKLLPNGSMKLLVALPDGSIMEMGAINCDDFYTCLCGENPIVADSLCGLDGNGSVETCAGGGAAPYKRTYTTVPGGEVVSGPAHDNWDLANLNAGTYLQTVESADGCVVEMQFTIPDAAVGCCDGILITEQVVSDDCPSRSHIFSLNGDYGDVTWTVSGPGTNYSSSDETLEVDFPSSGGQFAISATTSYGCEVETMVSLADCCEGIEIHLSELSDCPVTGAASLNGSYGSVMWQLRDANGSLISSHSGESWEVEFPLEGGDFTISVMTEWGCESSVAVNGVQDCRCYGIQLTYDGQVVADTLRLEVCDTTSIKEVLVSLSTISGDDVAWTSGPDHQQSFGSAWSGTLGIGTHIVSIAKACGQPCFDKVVIIVEEVKCCIENLQICGLCGTQDSVELQQGILLDTIIHPAICPGDSVWIDNCVFWDTSCYQTPAMLNWSITYLGEMGEVSLPVGENFEAWAFQIGYYQVSVTDGVTTAIKIHYIPLKDGCDSLGGDVQTSAFRMVAGSSTSTTEESEIKFSLYPNPTTGRVQIESAHQITRYNLVDATGQQMQEGVIPPGGDIDLGRDTPPGVYYLQFVFKNGEIISKKIVKIQ